MNNIILIDDDSAFTKAFVNEAAAVGINVSPQKSLEGLKKLLPRLADKYAAVVLDIKCLMHDGQAKEDADFIGAALHYIDTNVPGFPRFILTGDETEFESLRRYYPKEKMFLKTPKDQLGLFVDLQMSITNAEPLRLRRENPTVFEAFDLGLLSASKEKTLLSVLSNYEQTDPKKFKGILGDIREIHEDIYKCLNQRNKPMVPDRYMKANNTPSFTTAFYKHLEGNPDPADNYKSTTKIYLDSTIISTTRIIHNACSEYIHGTSKTGYAISPYTVKTLINGLMETIIWSKQY